MVVRFAEFITRTENDGSEVGIDMAGGIFGVHKPVMGKDEWLTPPDLVAKLGPFDLDPCSPINRPWDTAANHFTIADDGLSKTWNGSVWCNPPYGKETGVWLERCAHHGDAMALIFARTETDAWFRFVWPFASGILFIKGRLFFHHVSGKRADGNAGGPSALVTYGERMAERLRGLGELGKFIRL